MIQCDFLVGDGTDEKEDESHDHVQLFLMRKDLRYSMITLRLERLYQCLVQS